MVKKLLIVVVVLLFGSTLATAFGSKEFPSYGAFKRFALVDKWTDKLSNPYATNDGVYKTDPQMSMQVHKYGNVDIPTVMIWIKQIPEPTMEEKMARMEAKKNGTYTLKKFNVQVKVDNGNIYDLVAKEPPVGYSYRIDFHIPELIEDMKRGKELKVKIDIVRTYVYSLMGFNKTYNWLVSLHKKVFGNMYK